MSMGVMIGTTGWMTSMVDGQKSPEVRFRPQSQVEGFGPLLLSVEEFSIRTKVTEFEFVGLGLVKPQVAGQSLGRESEGRTGMIVELAVVTTLGTCPTCLTLWVGPTLLPVRVQVVTSMIQGRKILVIGTKELWVVMFQWWGTLSTFDGGSREVKTQMYSWETRPVTQRDIRRKTTLPLWQKGLPEKCPFQDGSMKKGSSTPNGSKTHKSRRWETVLLGSLLWSVQIGLQFVRQTMVAHGRLRQVNIGVSGS